MEQGFKEFFENDVKNNPLKAEYLLPTHIGGLLRDGKYTVKVLETRDSWFGVTYKEDKESVLGLVGGLKDLYDAVRLIREISERHVNKKLSDRFGRHFKADTYVIVPDDRRCREYMEHWCFENEMNGNQRLDGNGIKRDAFFYYLLVANIVLMIIVGILVFGAVRTVYFG